MSLDDVKSAVGLVTPPGFNPSRRLKFDLVMVGLVLMSLLHVAIACGYMGWLGLGGFAMANDVSTQQQTLASIQIRQLNHDIREAKTQICLAQQQRNQSALSSWSRTLDENTGSYYAVTKNWPRVLTCDELLVGASNAASPN